MLAWNPNGQGPAAPAGTLITLVGTAVAISAGVAVAYTGMGIQNPANSGKKAVVVRAYVAPTATGPAADTPIGLMKLNAGTASIGATSGMAGTAVAAGIAGFPSGTAVSVMTIIGTASVLNGTAAPGLVNSLNFVKVVGVLGTNISGIVAPDLNGEITVLPGETLLIGANAAVTGIPELVWFESPLTTSGI